MEESKKTTLFYDGLCPICSKEIAHYKGLDRDSKLSYVDINSPKFNAAEEGLDADLVHKVFHLRTATGALKQGVGGFLVIWEELDVFPFLQFMAKFPPSRFFMDVGYKIFARFRPRLVSQSCSVDKC